MNRDCIDLFCGAGGATSGMHDAGVNVVAAINHDPVAIESHNANYPKTAHYNEDITEFDVHLLPRDIWGIWMSAECTHYSIAKGGDPRDADSRTLSDELYRYAEWTRPFIIFVENVKEFLSWGPLNEKGKPISKKKGRDYVRWVKRICSLGYDYEYRILNSADYGAYTSRERYFGIFIRKGYPIRWPKPTHTKNPKFSGLSLFENRLKPWKAVADVLDLEDHGESILYGRKGKKPLVENTLRRILYGLKKYSQEEKHDAEFVMNHNFFNGMSPVAMPLPTIMASRRHWYKVHPCLQMIDRYAFHAVPAGIRYPMPTIMAKRDMYLNTVYLQRYNRDANNVASVRQPLGTLLTKDTFALIKAHHSRYIVKQNSQQYHTQRLGSPMHTITTRPGSQVVNAQFLQYYYGGGKGNSDSRIGDIAKPINTITTGHNPTLIKADFLQWYYGGHNLEKHVQDLERPINTITTWGNVPKIRGFIANYYSGGDQVRSLDGPISCITTVPKSRYVNFIHQQYSGSIGQAIHEPLHTITTKPKAHLTYFDIQYGSGKYNVGRIDTAIGALTTNPKQSLVSAELLLHATPMEYDHPVIQFYEELAAVRNEFILTTALCPSLYIPGTRTVNGYRVSNNIVDIQMRMLKVEELKKAQGFDEDYILKGNITDQKKFIGNSVVPLMARVLTEANLNTVPKPMEAIA